MQRRLLIILFLQTAFLSTAQVPFTSDDINLKLGNSWIFSSTGNIEVDHEVLGRAGKNGVYNFEAFGQTTDSHSNVSISATNEINGRTTAIIEQSEIENLPNSYPSTAHYIKYSDEHFEALEVESQGLISHGKIVKDYSFTPALFGYQNDQLFSTIPSNIVLNEAIIMNRSTIITNADEEFKTEVTEEIILDGFGEYTSPWGTTFANVSRFIIKQNILSFNRTINNDWIFDGEEEKQFLVFRIPEQLMPLASIQLPIEWNYNQIGNIELMEATFYKTLEVISSTIPYKNFNANIEIFPNPAASVIHIKIKNLDQKKTILNWYNANGILEESSSFIFSESRQTSTISTPKNSGIYYLQLINSKQTVTQKVLIQQ